MPSQPNKKHICFLTRNLMIGGVERVLQDTIATLSPYLDITVLSMYGDSDPTVVAGFEKAGATVLCPHLSYKSLYMCVPYLSKFHYGKILNTLHCDYVFSVNNDALNAGYYRKKAKTVCWNHTDNIEKHIKPKSFSQKIKSALMGILHRKYHAIWTVCDKIKEDYISAFGAKKVYTLPNPLDFQGIIEKSNKPCDFHVDKNHINVFTLGRLSQEKGFDRLIEIWAKDVKEVFPNARLYIIGEGNERGHLEQLIGDLALTDIVFLLGKQENPFPYLKQADLFVSSSHLESFGMVILEAFSLGLPVITTATSGGKCITKNGTLAVCTDNTTDALSQAIVNFLSAPNKYPHSIDAAVDYAKSYDIDSYQKKFLQLLDELDN